MPLPRGQAPFDTSGIQRDAWGIAHYTGISSSVVAMFRESVERHPQVEAVVELGGERLTYEQLWNRAARVAGGLVERGLARGDRVALLLPAGIDWIAGFLGTLLAGGVVVPVNTRFAGPEIEYVLSDSGALIVLRPGEALPDAAPLDAGPFDAAPSDAAPSDAVQSDAAPPREGQPGIDDPAPGDLAAIFYTSGTTGFPKGARTTHENFLSNVETTRRVVGLDPSDGPSLRSLVSVPLFHVTGCNTQLLVQLSLGGTTVVLPEFRVQDFLQAIVDERINVVVSVPAIYALALAQPNLAEFDLRSITRINYGGAPIAPALVDRIQKHFPNAEVGNGFGLTETSSIATYLPHAWATEHADSVGFAAPVVDLALRDVDDAGVGELLIRGPNVVDGYWNKPDATADTFVDGWLRSGDLARIDDGLVRVVDRSKDLINRGGENVYSVEVENALASAPGIADAAVVAVPDSVMGEKVGAVLVPSAGTVDVDAVLGHLAELLADFKVPQYVAISDEPLPRNPGGKLLKRTLRESTEWGAPLR